MTIERPIVVRSTARALFETDGVRTERVNRSASLVAEHDTLPKRHSFTSTVSSGTMGSNDENREQHLSHSVSDPAVSGESYILSLQYTGFRYYSTDQSSPAGPNERLETTDQQTHEPGQSTPSSSQGMLELKTG